MSFPQSVTKTSPVLRGRAARITLWVIQIALAGMFLMAGGSKLFGAKDMVVLFDQVGVGQWFRYVTGLIEAGAALALFVPSLAVFGALALVATMLCAVVAQIFIIHQSPVPPAILLLAAAAVVWARRDELLRRQPTVR
ncbi:MAG TPA: DoxX family protein [Gemmatimonadales bacterium]|jgi:uncharacterized membrane protein YphA (DoxX/SURF4 family)|nr:DoxX family protein [Gemmatimonadales bacterium]